jgi:hypothetical protein
MVDKITVRIILPSGVKEISGARDFVIEETLRMINLESDIGKSFVEVIPNRQEQLQFG